MILKERDTVMLFYFRHYLLYVLIKDNYVLPLLIVFAAYSMAILFKRSKKYFYFYDDCIVNKQL